MAISAVTVADSISKLSVSGVTIKDLDEILNQVTNRDTPVLMPAPQFFSDPDIDIGVSLGTGTGKNVDVNYTLNYRFFYEKVGTNRKLSDVYQSMVSKTMLILDAIITNDVVTGALDLQVESVGVFGIVVDPSDNPFFGVDISFRVLEFE